MESWFSGLLALFIIMASFAIIFIVIVPIFSKADDYFNGYPKQILSAVLALGGFAFFIYNMIVVAILAIALALFIFLFGNTGTSKKQDAHDNF